MGSAWLEALDVGVVEVLEDQEGQGDADDELAQGGDLALLEEPHQLQQVAEGDRQQDGQHGLEHFAVQCHG